MLTILQPEISYAGVFDFLTGQEPEGYQGVRFSEGKYSFNQWRKRT